MARERFPRTHNRDILFHFERERERENETLVTEDRRRTRLRVRFAKFLTRSRKGKVEIAAREERLGGQKCCVVVSDEITGRQIRGPLSGEFITEMRVQKCALSALASLDESLHRPESAGQVPLVRNTKIKTSFIEFRSMCVRE